MHPHLTAASAGETSPGRYVVRLSGALAALFGRREGAELWEDEMLGTMREHGLLTYPSPLLGRLLEKVPKVLEKEVLARLDATDRAMCSRVGGACRAAVADSGLPLAGMSAEVPLKIRAFVGSAKRLAWAKANDWPWSKETCHHAAAGGKLEVFTWAREHGCDWDRMTCAKAAAGGHLEVLKWAREHGCPWEEATFEVEDDVETFNCCSLAARGGHLEVLQWAREHGCNWDEYTCAFAATGGHLDLLKWVREHGCPW